MPRYILLLHESPSAMDGLSPEEIQRVIEEYTAWRRELEAGGLLAGGEKLVDGAARHLMSHDGAVRVTDGPYAEAKEVLGGFFVVEADDWESAETLARECPHLRYGGRVELRQIEEIHG